MKKTYIWIIVLILLSFVAAGVFLTIAPDRIPVHYDAHGNIDRMGSKYELLLLPLATAIVGGLMIAVGESIRGKGQEQSGKLVGTVNIWMLVFFNGLSLFFMWKALDGQALSESGMKWMLVFLMALFIPLGNLMPKVPRNSMMGLRTKWSMSSDNCWQKSQRYGGFLGVGTGMAGAVIIALSPAAWSAYILTALLVVMAVAGCVGTYLIYKKEQQ